MVLYNNNGLVNGLHSHSSFIQSALQFASYSLRHIFVSLLFLAVTFCPVYSYIVTVLCFHFSVCLPLSSLLFHLHFSPDPFSNSFLWKNLKHLCSALWAQTEKDESSKDLDRMKSYNPPTAKYEPWFTNFKMTKLSKYERHILLDQHSCIWDVWVVIANLCYYRLLFHWWFILCFHIMAFLSRTLLFYH